MGYLSRDAIINADDTDFNDVDVPEWGGTLRIRSISAAQRDAFESSMQEGKGKDAALNLRNLRARLIALCAVDENGNRLFANPDDVRRLGAKNARPMDRVFTACREMIGMSEEDVKVITEDFSESPDEVSSTD